jgi:hypothetical protein
VALHKHILPDSTEIEVVARRGSETIVKRMTIRESREMVKKPGWWYLNYQIGFR